MIRRDGYELHDFREVREHLRKLREHRERQRRRSRPFPANKFVRASRLVEAGYSVPEAADQLGITADEVRSASRYFRRHRDEMTELQRRRLGTHEELRKSKSAE